MQKKILITGANGFVGYHLLKASIEAGLETYAGVRQGSDISHLDGMRLHYAYLDYADLESLMKDFAHQQYDYIIHAAGATKAADDEAYKKVNAEFTTNIAVAAESICPKKFLFISSLAALGPIQYGNNNVLMHDSEPNPVTGYGRSKLLTENYVKALSGLNWNIVRPTAVYGPREKDLLILIKTIKKGFEIYLGKNRQILSFIHVRDLADATLRVCFSDHVHKTYNISDGKTYDTEKLFNIIKKELNRKTVKITIPIGVLRLAADVTERFNKGKISILNRDKISELVAENWNCSIKKAQDELSFTPRYDLKKGMKDTIRWYKINQWI